MKTLELSIQCLVNYFSEAIHIIIIHKFTIRCHYYKLNKYNEINLEIKEIMEQKNLPDSNEIVLLKTF